MNANDPPRGGPFPAKPTDADAGAERKPAPAENEGTVRERPPEARNTRVPRKRRKPFVL
jgi:hypothetical protein